MFRLSILSLATLALVTGCATSMDQPAPSPRSEPAPAAMAEAIETLEYNEGDSCTFRLSYNGRKATATETVTRVADGRVTFALVGEDGSRREMVVEQDRATKAVSLVDGQQLRFEPGMKWIDLPLKPGSAWSDDKAVIGDTFRAENQTRAEAIGWETVEVPAGQFRALKVVFDESFRGKTTAGDAFKGTGRLTYWLAQDVNCPVKLQYRNSFGATGSRELLSYEAS